MQPGQAERRTHDYVRHGTTTLFAALKIATGQVTGVCKPRHRHQEFLVFLRHVARGYPDRLAMLKDRPSLEVATATMLVDVGSVMLRSRSSGFSSRSTVKRLSEPARSPPSQRQPKPG